MYAIQVSATSNTGSTANKQVYGFIPDDVRPVIGSVSAAIVDSAGLGVPLQNKSTVVSVTVVGLVLSEGTTRHARYQIYIQADGANIASASDTYPANGSQQTITVPFNLLVQYEQITVRVLIYDTRGLYTSKEALYEFKPYLPPRILSHRAFRCDSDGTENNLGRYISLVVNWVYDPLDGVNSATGSFVWGQQGGQMSAPIDLPSGVLLGPFGDGTVDPEIAYVFRVTLTDRLESATTSDLIIPTMMMGLNFFRGGKGAAFGKIASQANLLDVPWAISCAGLYVNGQEVAGDGGGSGAMTNVSKIEFTNGAKLTAEGDLLILRNAGGATRLAWDLVSGYAAFNGNLSVSGTVTQGGSS